MAWARENGVRPETVHYCNADWLKVGVNVGGFFDGGVEDFYLKKESDGVAVAFVFAKWKCDSAPISDPKCSSDIEKGERRFSMFLEKAGTPRAGWEKAKSAYADGASAAVEALCSALDRI